LNNNADLLENHYEIKLNASSIVALAVRGSVFNIEKNRLMEFKDSKLAALIKGMPDLKEGGSR
tara:strand:+ start:87 stop:275 length:189 start_codon:yes stop_codon:yes gene_type:complete